MLSFVDLEHKFGTAMAYQYLIEIEKAANILSAEMHAIDYQTRLERACATQDRMNQTSIAA